MDYTNPISMKTERIAAIAVIAFLLRDAGRSTYGCYERPDPTDGVL